MKGNRKCVFCLECAELKFQWEIPWSIKCSESLQKLLDLEPFTSSFFEKAEYCRSCKEIIRDVDFISRSMSALDRRLAQSRQRIARMLLDNYEESKTTEEVIHQDHRGAAHTQGSATLPVTTDQSLNSIVNSLTSFKSSDDEELPLDSSPHYENCVKTHDPDALASFERLTSDNPSTSNRTQRFARLSDSVKLATIEHSTDVLDESGGSQLVKAENSGEVGFPCDFPGCNKRWETVYRLDCHKPTHIGWRSYKCTAPTCSSAFTRKQHLAGHVKIAHRNNTTEDEMTNHVETTREKPNFSGMTQTNVVSYENLESSTRKSARITSQPEKRPSLSEEDESDEDNYEDSEFRSSSDSQDEDKNGGELDVTRNKLGTITPEKKVQKVKSNTLNMTGYDRRKYQTERRILSLLSKHSKADVRQEIGKCTTPNGEFQSWEAIIQQPSSSLPEETFEDTFVFLLNSNQKKYWEYGSRRRGRKNTKNKTLYCEEGQCTYRTIYPNYMRGHQIKSHAQAQDRGSLPYNCDTCGSEFEKVAAYKRHRSHAHQNPDVRSICEFCGKSYTLRHELSAHIRQTHFDVATKFNCKFCTRPYFNAEDCGAHEKLHTRVRPFSCVLQCCPTTRQWGSLDELVKHVQGYHLEVKKVVCHVCGFASIGSTANSTLRRHLRCHTREKTVTCNYCPKTFLHSSEKVFHTQVHHKDQVKKEYTCEDCQEVFNVRLYYYRHRKNKHGSYPVKSKKLTE